MRSRVTRPEAGKPGTFHGRKVCVFISASISRNVSYRDSLSIRSLYFNGSIVPTLRVGMSLRTLCVRLSGTRSVPGCIPTRSGNDQQWCSAWALFIGPCRTPERGYVALRRCLQLRQSPPACALGTPSITCFPSQPISDRVCKTDEIPGA